MTKKSDAFGDRCKQLELTEAGRKAMPDLPLLVRLDGRAFHTFCRNFKRPYEPKMCVAMLETTRALVSSFKPAIGYTQSDEITLLFPTPQALFDGRFQKLTSVLAGFASAYFLNECRKLDLGRPDAIPHFDARAWQVPSKKEAIEVFVWREDDAVKNSISMAAQAYYSHKQLMNKNSAQKHDMLHERGVNWNDYPVHFRRGVYLKRLSFFKLLTEEERSAIPEKHRPPKDQKVQRTHVSVLDLYPIRREDVEAPERVLFGEAVEEEEGFVRFFLSGYGPSAPA